MLKKVSAVTLALVIMTAGTVGYSAPDDKKTEIVSDISAVLKEDSVIKIVTPTDGFITSSKKILISGRTNLNSSMNNLTVTVEVYSNRDSAIEYFENDIYINNGLINDELFNEMLSIESIEEEFIKIDTIDLNVDLLGLFNEEIELLTGKNKLYIYAKNDEDIVFEKEIYVTVTDENTALEYLENTINTNLINDIKSHIFGNESE